MKPSLTNQSLLPALSTLLGLTLAGQATAQTFTNIYTFTATTYDGATGAYSNSDGAGPISLILSGSTLYGTTSSGGIAGYGTVFRVNTNGTGFTNLHSFNLFGSDGAYPYAELLLLGSTLYGTTWSGGSGSHGTVFAVNTDGTGFTNLHNFTEPRYGTNSDGAYFEAAMISSGNTLYGTSTQGGSSGEGVVFAVNVDGAGFTNLHNFSATHTNSSGVYTNSDGAYPNAPLILVGNTLYGTTGNGGMFSSGTVFALDIDGTGFRIVHNFTALSNGTNSDGTHPSAGLILSGNTLYGAALGGGGAGYGTVFKVNTDGTAFRQLHNFGTIGDRTSSLALSGNILYGALTQDGIFAVNTDGTGFTTLYSFTATQTNSLGVSTNSDGAYPAGFVLSDNTLFGTAGGGGGFGQGTIFSLFIPPHLGITPAAQNLVLTWPTNATGFTLQSTTNLGLTSIWTTNFPAPVVVNGQNTVTNPLTGTQQFYRLSQ